MKKIKTWCSVFKVIGIVSLLVLLVMLIILHLLEIPSSWDNSWIPVFKTIRNISFAVAPLSFLNGFALESIYIQLKKSSD